MRKIRLSITIALLSSLYAAAQNPGDDAKIRREENASIAVASYYFPNYHLGDKRNVKKFGAGWSEWELVKDAKPRFPGHHQPNVPAWGYTDESNPADMAIKIGAAANYGIDAFIFDWYYYDDGLFLERGLEKGFFEAHNNNRLKFALMWANHDWIDIHPRTLKREPAVIYSGKITPQTFDTMTDYIISTYFKHSSYWKIEGKPYFSVYELSKLLENFGSVSATRQALDQFRGKVVKAGFPGLHLNAVVWGQPILPLEKTPADIPKLIADLGFDSVTSYVWIHHVALPQFPQTPYIYVQAKYFEYWDQADGAYKVPYYPNVTMGWDSSPRACQDDPFVDKGYPFMATIGQNTPDAFRNALEETRTKIMKRPAPNRILNINCWNEWTEGSYLEPDAVHGMTYLQAIKDVFGK